MGGALFLAILLVMPLFVWKIDVRGNDKISAGEIRAAAAELKTRTLQAVEA